MARRPSLSPSKLTCYLACPHRYYWTYESQQGQWFLKARSYYSFGISLHRALENFHKAGDTGLDVTETLLGALEENWVDAGYASVDQMQAAFGEGKAILERYAEERGATSEGKVLFVERHLKKPMGEWDLIGRADRIDELDDGTIEIVDYKSGRGLVSEDELANDVAMNAYSLMVRDQFPGRNIAATLYSLRSGEKVKHAFTEEELDEFAFAVRELGDKVRNHYWEEFKPRPKNLCKTCEFISLCKRDPEFAAEVAGILAS